jgi:hypothetical protein
MGMIISSNISHQSSGFGGTEGLGYHVSTCKFVLVNHSKSFFIIGFLVSSRSG